MYVVHVQQIDVCVVQTSYILVLTQWDMLFSSLFFLSLDLFPERNPNRTNITANDHASDGRCDCLMPLSEITISKFEILRLETLSISDIKFTLWAPRILAYAGPCFTYFSRFWFSAILFLSLHKHKNEKAQKQMEWLIFVYFNSFIIYLKDSANEVKIAT